MAGNSSIYIIGTFGISLFLSVFLISYFAVSQYGSDFGLQQIDLPKNIDSYSAYSTTQDYTTGSYNQSLMGFTSQWVYNENIGLILSNFDLLTGWGRILIHQVKPDSSGGVTNNYYINNSVRKDYAVILSINPYSIPKDNNYVWVKSDGLHVPFRTCGLLTGNSCNADKKFIPLPNANQYTDVTIKTYYNTQTNKATITFNGILYDLGIINIPQDSVILDSVYAGVETNTIGFTLKKVIVNRIGTTEYKDDTQDVLAQISSMILAMARTASMTLPEEIMPTELQMILIFPQEALLLIGIAGFIRGV